MIDLSLYHPDIEKDDELLKSLDLELKEFVVLVIYNEDVQLNHFRTLFQTYHSSFTADDNISLLMCFQSYPPQFSDFLNEVEELYSSEISPDIVICNDVLEENWPQIICASSVYLDLSRDIINFEQVIKAMAMEKQIICFGGELEQRDVQQVCWVIEDQQFQSLMKTIKYIQMGQRKKGIRNFLLRRFSLLFKSENAALKLQTSVVFSNGDAPSPDDVSGAPPTVISIDFPLPDGRMLVQGPLNYNQDGLATSNNCSFLTDPLFSESFEFACQAIKKKEGETRPPIEYRVNVATWAALHALNLQEGDFVECGVLLGFISLAVMNYIDFQNLDKKFYLFDTFEGVDQDLITEKEKQFKDKYQVFSERYQDCYELAKENFSPFPNATLIKGRVPDSLTQVSIDKVCYLHIDMNSAMAELGAIKYFWGKLVKGAIVLFDDYNFWGAESQREVLNDFADKQGVKILGMPTGQGLLIKP